MIPTRPNTAKKLLLIGWDAADWKIINPLLDLGKLPNLERVVQAGVIGNIATLQPCLSPLLWTSLATGKTADKHGIVGFIEPFNNGQGVQLSSSTSRTAKSLWNILTQRELRSIVVGWYATHPAEPIRGVCVSNRFLEQMPMAPTQVWEVPPGAVHPPELVDSLSSLRMHPAELNPADLQPMIPRIGEIDHRQDNRPWVLARAIANTVSTHSVATTLLATESWDFAAIYYDALDIVGHDFMPYYPPKMAHLSDRDYELYSQVIPEMYIFFDQMLGTLLELVGEETTVLLVSDHGFYSDHLRPRTVQSGEMPESQAAAWHRPYGVFAAKGPQILKDERVYGASLLDIAPTVLMLLGLPIGQDMDGKPLTQILQFPPVFCESIPSWETELGDAGMHPNEVRENPFSAAAAVQQLIALGYLPPVAEDAQRAVELAKAEGAFNLATVHLHHGRPAKAIDLLDELRLAYPDEPRYLIGSAKALAELKRYAECRSMLDLVEAKGWRCPESDVLFVAASLGEGNVAPALARARDAESLYPPSPTWHYLIGKLYAEQQLWDEARVAYEKGLALDDEYPLLHNGMAQVLVRLRDHEQAAEHALRAVGLLYFFPEAHFHLGTALAGIGQPLQAIRAMQTAVTMEPQLVEAHWRLAELFEQQNDLANSLRHRSLAMGNASPFDVI